MFERLGRMYADRSIGGVVLTGPAGAGKSRLAEELLTVAAGRPTARVVGHPATQSIPLGAMAHLLPADLTRNIGLGDDDRASLFHRARQHLAEHAGSERLLVVADDVDQLDETSLGVLDALHDGPEHLPRCHHPCGTTPPLRDRLLAEGRARDPDAAPAADPRRGGNAPAPRARRTGRHTRRRTVGDRIERQPPDPARTRPPLARSRSPARAGRAAGASARCRRRRRSRS